MNIFLKSDTTRYVCIVRKPLFLMKAILKSISVELLACHLLYIRRVSSPCYLCQQDIQVSLLAQLPTYLGVLSKRDSLIFLGKCLYLLTILSLCYASLQNMRLKPPLAALLLATIHSGSQMWMENNCFHSVPLVCSEVNMSQVNLKYTPGKKSPNMMVNHEPFLHPFFSHESYFSTHLTYSMCSTGKKLGIVLKY